MIMNKKEKNIVIVGIGYVGLSNAITLAKNNNVKLLDICKNKIDLINKKISPIDNTEFKTALKSVSLSAFFNTADEYKKADYVLIATPTNYLEKEKKFDTTSVETTLDMINKVNKKATIVIRSTLPIGYTRHIVQKFQTNDIIFCPEFLTENHAISDSITPTRIIVGLPYKNSNILKKANNFISLLKQCIKDNSVPVLITTSDEAESIKLFSNAYLALRVSFFNEIDTFAQSKNYDAYKIIKGVCLDPRIGNFYNNPSFGYGGYCLPKDTKQLADNYDNIPHHLISSIVTSNNDRKIFIAKKIVKIISLNSYKTVGIYRLVMKTNSTNYRQSAIIDVIDMLLKEKNINIIIYEPILKEIDIPDVTICNDFKKFTNNSDFIIANRVDTLLMHSHKPFYSADLFHQN